MYNNNENNSNSNDNSNDDDEIKMIITTLADKYLVIHKHVNSSDVSRRFGVFMTPLSR